MREQIDEQKSQHGRDQGRCRAPPPNSIIMGTVIKYCTEEAACMFKYAVIFGVENFPLGYAAKCLGGSGWLVRI